MSKQDDLNRELIQTILDTFESIYPEGTSQYTKAEHERKLRLTFARWENELQYIIDENDVARDQEIVELEEDKLSLLATIDRLQDQLDE